MVFLPFGSWNSACCAFKQWIAQFSPYWHHLWRRGDGGVYHCGEGSVLDAGRSERCSCPHGSAARALATVIADKMNEHTSEKAIVRWKIFAILIAATLCAQPTIAQVYRCKGPNGIEMQQVPCIGQGEKLNVRPASGSAAAVPSQADSSQPPGGAKVKSRVEKNVEALQDERLRREGWFEMQALKAKLNNILIQCAAEQRRIGNERAYSNNNLAGATRDVSITTEMKAAASVCDTKVRSAEREVDQLVKHCEKIKCIVQN